MAAAVFVGAVEDVPVWEVQLFQAWQVFQPVLLWAAGAAAAVAYFFCLSNRRCRKKQYGN